MKLTALGGGRFSLSFIAPGDNGPCGTPAAYVSHLNGRLVDLGIGPPVPGGTTFSAELSLPSGSRRLLIQARDAAGNLGAPAGVAVP